MIFELILLMKCFLYFIWNALHFAAYGSQLEIVKLILEKADDLLNSKDTDFFIFMI